MCGIAGIITTKPINFDYTTFCHLGIANDARGGDSCGIFIDGEYEYGIAKDSLFVNFFQKSKLLEKTITSQIALLHCRKASVGNITIKQAQPVLIEEDGKVKFVVMHNGTIYNYKELAEKYIPDVDITGLTDSQVMTNIFYHKGYDVLNEYNGGAVFVIIDCRENYPKLYLFKGKSKESKYGVKESEERPLWYTIDKELEEIVFSSLWPHLMASRPYCEVNSLEPNKLFYFDGNKLVVVQEYNRKDCIQAKESTTSYTTSSFYKEYYSTYNYIVSNSETLLYTHNGTRCHGRYVVDKYGQIENTLNKYNKELWFFHGILMCNEKAFQSLNRMQKKSGLSDLDFFKKYHKLIYLSSKYRIFKSDGKYWKINSESEKELYNGILNLETSSIKYLIVDGCKSNSKPLC